MMRKNLKQTLLTALFPFAASAILLGCSPQASSASSSEPATAAPAAVIQTQSPASPEDRKSVV